MEQRVDARDAAAPGEGVKELQRLHHHAVSIKNPHLSHAPSAGVSRNEHGCMRQQQGAS